MTAASRFLERTEHGRSHRAACCSCEQNVGSYERVASTIAGVGLLGASGKARPLTGIVMALAGASLVYRGATGHCGLYQRLGINTSEKPRNPAIGVPAQRGVRVERSIAIDRPPQEIYKFWRKLENLPAFMSDLVSVQSTDGRRSHWVAKAPLGATVEWDAEIINDRESNLIAWRSLPNSDVDTAGSVHFHPSADGKRTIVDVSLKYNPLGGKLGVAVAHLFGQDADAILDRDLAQLKRVMESQPSAAQAAPSQTPPAAPAVPTPNAPA